MILFGHNHYIRRSRRHLAVLLAVFIVQFVVFESVGSNSTHALDRVDKLKAVYLFNFGNYVSWPARNVSAGARKQPFVIGIAGKSAHPIATVVNQIGKRKRINNREIKSTMIKDPNSNWSCDVLFIPLETPAPIVAALLKKAKGRPILLVGEAKGFVGPEAQGMIWIHLVEKKLKFDLCPRSLADAQLKPSSKLINLANAIVK